VFEETDKGVLLTPMNEQYFKSFAGILKGTGNLKEDIKQMKDEENSWRKENKPKYKTG